MMPLRGYSNCFFTVAFYFCGMNKSKVFIIILVLQFYCLAACAQIVNMESQRYRTDTTGWSGTAGGNFDLSNYGKKVYAVNANAHAQYQAKKSLYLLFGNYGFLKGEEQAFIDNAFVHFRYNYKLGKVVRLEAFTQLQENAVTKIDSRFLIGAGPRFKITGSKKISLYAGILPMYEREKEVDNPQMIHDWRLSNYLSFTFRPAETTEIISTTYYQPVMFSASDYRMLHQTSFRLKATKRVSVVINYNYQFDASPAADVPTDTYSLNTGFEISLK